MPTKEQIKKWEKLYANAMRALKDGVPLDKVDAIIKKRSGGKVAGFAALMTLYEPDLPPSQFSHSAPAPQQAPGPEPVYGGVPQSEMQAMTQRLGPKPSDDTPEETYWKARRALEAGVPMQTVNEIIRKRGFGDGFASLEQQIKPHTLYGEETQGIHRSAQLMRSGLQGVFGVGDELSAGMKAAGAMVPGGMSPSQAYDAEIQRQRALNEEFAKQHPFQHGGAQLYGAGTAGLAGAAMGLPMLPRVGGGLTTRLLAGGAVVGGAGAGAGILDEFMRQEGTPGERLQSGNYGEAAVIGGITGAGLNAVGTLGAPVVRKLGRPVLRKLMEQGGRELSESEAARTIARNELIRVLRKSKIKPDEIEAVIAALPEEAVLADASGTARRAARTQVNLASELEDTAVPALAQREGRRGERIADDLRESANVRNRSRSEPRDLPGSAAQAREGLEEATEQIRVYGYDEIEKVNPVVLAADDEWLLLLRSPEMKEAFKTRGFDIDAVLENRALTFREAQALKGTMERRVEEARVNKDSYDFQRWKKLKERFYNLLKRDVPEYDETQRKMALVFAQEDALEAGRKAAGANANEVRAAFNKLASQEEKDMFRAGMLDELERKVTETASGGGVANKLTSVNRTDAAKRTANAQRAPEDRVRVGRGGQTERKLRVLFDNDEELDRFLAKMENEARMSRTHRAVTGNSTSAGQLADIFRSGITKDIKRAAVQLATEFFDDHDVREEAALIVGRFLMETQDEAGARKLARLLKEAGFGAARGRTAAAVAAPQVSGLLFEEE